MKIRLEQLDVEDYDLDTDLEEEELRKAPNEKGFYLRNDRKEKRNEKNYRNNKRSYKKELQEAFLNK